MKTRDFDSIQSNLLNVKKCIGVLIHYINYRVNTRRQSHGNLGIGRTDKCKGIVRT